MKLVSLNTWGGKAFKPLSAFIAEHAHNTDIFCLQEVSRSPEPRNTEENVRDDLFGDIAALLPEHTGYFVTTQEGFNWKPVTHKVAVGNTIFIRTSLPVAQHGEVFIQNKKNSLIFEEGLQGNWFSMPRALQFLQTIDAEGKALIIFNYHGIWHKDGKGNIPERLKQSKDILAFMEQFPGRKILSGDFNLDMDTEGVALFETSMRNLVREFSIPTTRSTTYYPKYQTMPFADYVFTGKDINVKEFTVPDAPASDHLPLIIDFD